MDQDPSIHWPLILELADFNAALAKIAFPCHIRLSSLSVLMGGNIEWPRFGGDGEMEEYNDVIVVTFLSQQPPLAGVAGH